MHIAIAKKLLSSVGGSEIHARLLARALAARGHDVLLVGMRPAWMRPGIPRDALAGGAAGVVHHENAVSYVFVPSRWGRAGAAVDGILPTDLADPSALASVLAGREVVHVIAREWAASYERAARRVGAAVVETPLVHPGQPFSGNSPADVARYRRDAAV